MIDEILEALKGKTASEVSGLVTAIMDILLVTTSRQTHRMFYPLNILVKLKSITNPSTGNIRIGDRDTGLTGVPQMLRLMNMSGCNGFYVYKLISMIPWKMEGNFSSSQAKQIFFHCIFGSFN